MAELTRCDRCGAIEDRERASKSFGSFSTPYSTYEDEFIVRRSDFNGQYFALCPECSQVIFDDLVTEAAKHD